MSNHTSDFYFYMSWFSSSPDKQLLYFITFLLTYVIALIGNLLLIFVIISESHLHTPMYFFLGNLAFVDMCYSSVTLPKLMDIFLTQNNAIPFMLCFAQLYLFMTTASTEVFLLTSMAYDRYVAICNPLFYVLVMNNRINILLVMGSWIFGFINAILVTTFTFRLCFSNSRVIHQLFCDMKSLFSISCSKMKDLQFIIYLEVFFAGLCPFLVSLISYAKIISSILKVQSTQGRRKTFSTCTAHLTVLLLFYGTSICMYMRPLSENLENHDHLFSVLYLAVTPMLNPLIYSLRNQDVKKALKKLFAVE
ncbi:hypothetical protein XELAEV_18018712mg [Xenopus laevis]|uniref:Olfactory receptor n=1 Tax=Xenopus laevis TaxID=8355 RepID=A0A974DFP3_XENLA|nr:hypothetical protein XELAEV_18018712mg [Xenopus laevis]